MDESKNIAKTYDPKQVEERLYENWMEKGYLQQIKARSLIQ